MRSSKDIALPEPSNTDDLIISILFRCQCGRKIRATLEQRPIVVKCDVDIGIGPTALRMHTYRLPAARDIIGSGYEKHIVEIKHAGPGIL